MDPTTIVYLVPSKNRGPREAQSRKEALALSPAQPWSSTKRASFRLLCLALANTVTRHGRFLQGSEFHRFGPEMGFVWGLLILILSLVGQLITACC